MAGDDPTDTGSKASRWFSGQTGSSGAVITSPNSRGVSAAQQHTRALLPSPASYGNPTASPSPASPKNLQPFAIPQQSAHPLLELILFSSHSRHSFKETLPTLKNTWKKSPGARSELIFAVWRVPLCCRMSRGRSSVCLGSPYVLQYRGWEQSSWLSNHQCVEVRS